MTRDRTPKYLMDCVRRIRRIEWLLNSSSDHPWGEPDNLTQYWVDIASRLSLTHLKQISAYYDYYQKGLIDYKVELLHVDAFLNACVNALLEKMLGLNV